MTKPVLQAMTWLDLLDDVTLHLSWTKLGVALSTTFTAVTGLATCIQAAISGLAHTEWQAFAAAIGLHGISHTAREAKRYIQTSVKDPR